MKKRLIALALTIAMLLETMPAQGLVAYADDSLPAEAVTETVDNNAAENAPELPLEIPRETPREEKKEEINK